MMSDTVQQAEKSWSARVAICEGKNVVEEVMFDSYPAKTEGTARAIAVELGYGYLKTLSLDASISGVTIIMVSPDEPAKEGIFRPFRPDNSQHRAAHGMNSSNGGYRQTPLYKPFTCPIVSLCAIKYNTSKDGGSFNATIMAKEAQEV